jgi:hypothetical protein
MIGAIGNRAAYFSLSAMIVLTLSLRAVTPSFAQEGFSWEYTPYKIQVWIADDGQVAATPSKREKLISELSQLFEVTGFHEWTTQVRWMPPEIHWAPGEPAQQLTTARMRQGAKEVLTYDKLFLVQLLGPGRPHVELSEFDVQLRHWSELETSKVESEALLADTIFQLVRRAFRPIVQLENPNEKLIWARPRAIQLATSADSPIRIPT